jgi:hypothetical protein
MTNHIHLLVQVGEVPLGALVHRVASRYARSVQARLRTTGHLFENRFHAVMVAADAHLLELLRYIHLNPVRAGIVDDVAAYRWSSHPVYAGQRAEPWLTTSFLLDMLEARPARQRAAYARFLDNDQPDGVAAATDPVDPPATMAVAATGRNTRDGRPRHVARCSQALQDLVEQAVGRFGITRESLLSPVRARSCSSARQWIARTAVDGGIASLSEVARFLGRHESSLRKGLARRVPRTAR